jgi:peptide-methionine (S)-S-oxide reductase
MEIATFGAGCFWCIEACFKDLNGVFEVMPGYMGGSSDTANYKDVCSGSTDHAEVAQVKFNEELISYDQLLEMFWFIHNPTQLNRQGGDVGRQYRSIIFYHSESQMEKSMKSKKILEENKVWDAPIVTEIESATQFFEAEEYHKNYLANNPSNMYCQSVVRPKVDKFKESFRVLLK